ncbi:hypothetical protein [Streptomyces sp. NPDC046939]|uniref:hypothetical protein n=1 Tax=Streptomyces sp. NPDC046939 TaxID=3155376 RepID=UPI0033D0A840
MGQREQDRGAEAPPTADAPWWAGLGPLGGVVLVAIGLALLLWLVWGSAAGDNWSQYYGAAKVLAIGSVVAGTTLLARGRERHG